MKCPNCGNIVNNNSIFCNICGYRFNINNKGLNKGQKIIILSLLSAVLIFLIIIVFSSSKKYKDVNNNDVISSDDGTKTIMMYVVGSNLESDSAIATADLKSIDPSLIDLDKIKIIIYTGGTKKWHNFVSNEENAIYELTSDGFKKVQTYPKENMGDPNTFTTFLDYGYDNYKSSNYYLLMYDHGGAIDGAIYDDFTNDNLSLKDFHESLDNSKLHKDSKKFDGVIFRTCLNGTVEVANLFSPYANYLTASEEVTYGSSTTNVLSFLNNIKSDDNGLSFGQKYIEQYKELMKRVDPFKVQTSTYSIIDLSKIDDIKKELSNFISGVNISDCYINISRIRSNLYQFGEDSDTFDMVDLYSLIDSIKDYSSVPADNLLSLIKSAVLENNTNIDSYGLSIYFPYKGSKAARNAYLSDYKDFNFSEDYYEFIYNFDNMKSTSSKSSFSISSSKMTKTSNNKEISIELSDDVVSNYSSSKYIIYEQDKDHPNYYAPIFNANNATLNGNILSTNIDDNMVKIKDSTMSDDEAVYIEMVYEKNGNSTSMYFPTILVNTDSDDLGSDNFMRSAEMFISPVDGKLRLTSARAISSNERVDGTLFDFSTFNTIEMYHYNYRILDSNGNYTGPYESAPVLSGYSFKLNDYELIRSTLDSGDNYYCAFIIYDENNNPSYSKLMKVS